MSLFVRLFVSLFLSLFLSQSFAYTLSGTIFGGSNPLPNATVNLVDTGSSSQVGTTTSDANGDYSFSVNDGNYNLQVLAPNGSGFGDSDVNNITVNGSNVIQNIVIVASAYALSGVVRGPDGSPASNVSVKIRNQITLDFLDTVLTNQSGEYTVPLTVGTYRVEVSKYGNASAGIPTPTSFRMDPVIKDLVITGDTTQDITLPFVTLSGFTTDSNGVPVSGVQFKLVTGNFNSSYLGFSALWSVATESVVATSDVNGAYSITLLPHDDYSIKLVPPFGSGLATTIIDPLSINADKSQNLVLDQAYALSGVVRGPDGSPASNVSVKIRNQITLDFLDTVLTNQSGEYTVPLTVGTYRVEVSKYGNASAGIPTPTSFRMDPVIKDLVITGDTTQDITLPFVTLSGFTTDSNGVPVSGVQFKLVTGNFNSSYLGFSALWSVATESVVATSDVNGAYSITLLPHDDYSITIFPPINSGFSNTIVNDLSVLQETLQNVILVYSDVTLPKIVSGPRIVNVTDTVAKVEWQTNEPATSYLTINGAPVTVPGYRAYSGESDHLFWFYSIT